MVRMDRQTRQRGRQYLEDRRGQGGRTRRRVGGGGGRAMGGGAAGLGGFGLIIFLIIQSCSGQSFQLEPGAGLDSAGPIESSGGVATGVNPDDETVDYILGLMADIQDTWAEYFDQAGLNYRPANERLRASDVCGRPVLLPAPQRRKRLPRYHLFRSASG